MAHMALKVNTIVHYSFSLALVLKAIGVGNLNFMYTYVCLSLPRSYDRLSWTSLMKKAIVTTDKSCTMKLLTNTWKH